MGFYTQKIEEKLSQSEDCSNRDDILTVKINALKDKYKNAPDDEQKGRISLSIARQYHSKTTFITGESDQEKYSLDLLYKSNAYWISKAYQNGNARAAYLFYLAIKNQGKKDHFNYLIKEAKNLEIPINEDGQKQLLSYGFEHGQRSVYWALSNAIKTKDTDHQNMVALKLLEERNLPLNDDTNFKLLIGASLGKNLKASITLHEQINDNKIDQSFIQELFKEGVREPVSITEIDHWAIGIGIASKEFREKLKNDLGENKILFIEKKKELSYNRAHFLRARIVEKLNAF